MRLVGDLTAAWLVSPIVHDTWRVQKFRSGGPLLEQRLGEAAVAGRLDHSKPAGRPLLGDLSGGRQISMLRPSKLLALTPIVTLAAGITWPATGSPTRSRSSCATSAKF
jgi:hypothetical protein